MLEIPIGTVKSRHARGRSRLRPVPGPHERCRRFDTAPRSLTPARALAHVEARAEHLAEPRPEYGHATKALCIVGRRALTRDLFLDRRAFLVSYDPEADPDCAILEQTLVLCLPLGAFLLLGGIMFVHRTPSERFIAALTSSVLVLALAGALATMAAVFMGHPFEVGLGRWFAVLAFHMHPGAGLLVDPVTPLGDVHILGLDALSAPLLPLLALITLVTIIARPRRVAAPHTLGALLVTQGLLVGLLSALDLGLFTLFWIAAAVPALIEARRRRAAGAQNLLPRAFAVFLLVSALPLVIATLVLLGQGLTAASATATATTAAATAPLHLAALAARGMHTNLDITACVLIGLAVVLRSAAVPMHGWLPISFEHGPPGMVALLWAAQPGAYLLARVLLPVFATGAGPFRIILIALGVFTAVYAALVGLAQTDLKRAIGFLATSYGGVLWIGLSSSHVDAISGALVLWISAGAAITGLSLVAVAVEARTGTTDVRRLGGLARTMPRLATAFAIFGLAAVGLPGMLGFVAEDMLIHGVLDTFPVVAATLLVATVLNGITVMRAYAGAFLGPGAPAGVRVPAGRDLRPRERLAAVVLACGLVVFGLLPGSLVAVRSRAAVQLSPDPPAADHIAR